MKETANNFGIAMKKIAPEMKKNEEMCINNSKKIGKNTAKLYDINNSVVKLNEHSGSIINSLENSLTTFKNAALKYADTNNILSDTAKIFSKEKTGEEYLNRAGNSGAFPDYSGLSKQLVMAEK